MSNQNQYDTDPQMRSEAMPGAGTEAPERTTVPEGREGGPGMPVRTEVVDNRSSREMNREGMPAADSNTGGDWAMPEMNQFKQRFDELQAEFIQEPRAAVEKAETLVDEAIKRMMVTLQERLRRIQGETGGTSDTEKLRVTMMRYREFMDSLGDRRAA